MPFIETNTIVHLERVPTNARESARITATSDGRVNTYLVVLQYFNVHARTKPDESITSEGWGSNLFGRAPRKMGSDRWQRARLSSSRGCQLKPARMGRIRQMLSERDERGHAPWPASYNCCIEAGKEWLDCRNRFAMGEANRLTVSANPYVGTLDPFK